MQHRPYLSNDLMLGLQCMVGDPNKCIIKYMVPGEELGDVLVIQGNPFDFDCKKEITAHPSK